MRVLFVIEPYKVEPLGLGYLATALKRKGHEPFLLKYEQGDDKFFEEIGEIKPQIVAFSVTTGKHRKFIEISKMIKKRRYVLSVFGGAHPTYYPEMIKEDGVDFIVRGEGEKSFNKLLDRIMLSKKCKRVNEFYELEQNLDRIGFPDREFMYRYLENRNNPIKNVITSRGCFYNCNYCMNGIYREFYKGQNWVRFRSPENVVEECLELKKYPLKLIYFQDDEFLTNPNMEKLLDVYKRKVRVPFHCQIRIEFLTKEIAKKLKDAGCRGVTFAIESGNDYIRQKVLYRKMSKERIMEGSKILHDVGLKFRVENMVGIPGESLNQMFETLDLNKKLKAAISWCSIFQPYSGLPLGEYARKNKFWNGSISNVKETFFEDTVLETTIGSQIANLQRLFSLVSWLRLPNFLVRWLIRRRKNSVYNWIYFKFKYWRYDVMYGM